MIAFKVSRRASGHLDWLQARINSASGGSSVLVTQYKRRRPDMYGDSGEYERLEQAFECVLLRLKKGDTAKAVAERCLAQFYNPKLPKPNERNQLHLTLRYLEGGEQRRVTVCYPPNAKMVKLKPSATRRDWWADPRESAEAALRSASARREITGEQSAAMDAALKRAKERAINFDDLLAPPKRPIK